MCTSVDVFWPGVIRLFATAQNSNQTFTALYITAVHVQITFHSVTVEKIRCTNSYPITPRCNYYYYFLVFFFFSCCSVSALNTACLWITNWTINTDAKLVVWDLLIDYWVEKAAIKIRITLTLTKKVILETMSDIGLRKEIEFSQLGMFTKRFECFVFR